MVRNQIAVIGSLLADETRAELLTALMDGRAHTTGELARHVGVSPSTVSEHLGRLLDAGMVRVEKQGRHRYYQLADAEVAELLETIGGLETPLGRAPKRRVEPSLVYARSCYDHLAGQLAVRVYDHMIEGGHLEDHHDHIHLTPSGFDLLVTLGADPDALRSKRRPIALRCLDWTERRHHLAGSAGAALLQAMLRNRWLVPGQRPRSLRVTRAGQEAFARRLSIA